MANNPHQARTTDAHTATAHAAPAHQHGTADLRVHERTFEGFVRIAAWSAALSIAVLVFLALTNV